MINDVFAPVVKTLFIPEGNPGVQEVQEIRAVPRVIEANGDAQEITVSGEMDLSISYIPVSDTDDEIPWRTIHFSEENEFNQGENEAKVIARLESALKEDQELEEDDYNEEKREDQCYKIDISVPFTLAIDTDGFRGEHIVEFNPCIHSSNWFVVGPNAIEYEAVLQFASQEGVRGREIKKEEPAIMEMESLTEKEFLEDGSLVEQLREKDPSAQEFVEEDCAESRAEQKELQKQQEEKEQKMMEEKEFVAQQEMVQQEMVQQEMVQQEMVQQEIVQQEIVQQELIEKELRKQEETIIHQQDAPVQQESMVMPQMIQQVPEDQNIKQEQSLKLKSRVQQETKSIPTTEIKIEEGQRVPVESGYFQMKFYRVQLGEDLDAIADRFNITRDRISTYNSINEEEIRTGLLLSIPHR